MVVFFDIDGTLVDDETQIIPQSTVRAVEKLAENGHIPVINTGRPFYHIDPRLRAMAFRGWVCGCGMEVRLGDRWLYRTKADPEVCRKTVDIVRACRANVLYEGSDGTLVLDGEFSSWDEGAKETERLRKKGVRIVTLEEHPEFFKFITVDRADTDRKALVAGLSQYYEIIDRGNEMLEVMGRGCSKAGGMKILMEALGRQETLAIGDSTNDLPMFALADHTVCMGDGMEEVKAQAEFVTAPVLGDGIEKALLHYGLI